MENADREQFEDIESMVEYLQNEYDIEVLSIRDYGSNAWNLDSENSDMDAGMVYTHKNTHDYIKLGAYRQNIDRKFLLEGEDFELIGWNIDRFAELLNKSNPSMIEWLNSDIKYYEDKELIKEKQPTMYKNLESGLLTYLKEHANENFKPIALWGHYRDMGKANYNKYIDNRNDLSIKRHLYILRGLTYAKYVLETHERPPLDFVDFYENHLPELEIDETIYKYIGELIRKKKNGQANHSIADKELWNWMEKELNREIDHKKHDVNGINKNKINAFIKKVVH